MSVDNHKIYKKRWEQKINSGRRDHFFFGTLANLRSHIIKGGRRVVGATVLTGKHYSARLVLTKETLKALRLKHGKELEDWWLGRFGFGSERLTESEARYLLRTPDADRVRNKIVAALEG